MASLGQLLVYVQTRETGRHDRRVPSLAGVFSVQNGSFSTEVLPLLVGFCHDSFERHPVGKANSVKEFSQII